jgi:hypothetical protein
VPPRDARATAERIISAYEASNRTAPTPLHFLDLNAISPSTARAIAFEFSSRTPDIKLIDGGIIGGPPIQKTAEDGSLKWNVPSICLSGPEQLSSAPKSGAELAKILNTKHVGQDIGTASGLKCCFASLTKGYTALAIQSFSTAQQLGVLGDLQDYIGTYAPARLVQTQKSLTAMPPKAGRWVEEMREIGKTFNEDGGWEENVFEQIAGVYEFVSDKTDLGKEHVDKRVRGKTTEDAVAVLGKGLEQQKSQKQ